jgi:hypothetical protein
MLCEACHNSKAVLICHGEGGESARLCLPCAEARLPSEVSQRIREARAKGEIGGVIEPIGWTSYSPFPFFSPLSSEGDER